MHRSALVLALLLTVASAYGAPAPFELEFASDGREAGLKLIANYRNRVRINAVADNRSARAIVIPAVGSVQGANGTFFRSDITLVNWRETAQRVGFIYLPQGNPSGTLTATATLPANRPPFTIADFVGTQLKTSGLGALLIIPIDAQGNTDDNGAIDAFSRIYTPQPNTTRGTVSQPFAGVDPVYLDGQYEAAVLGLRLDSDFRTNFGIVNLSDVALPFSVLVLPESAPPGTQLNEVLLTLPPLSMTQQGIGSGANGPMNLIISVDADIPNDDFQWIAYASTTDNTTGDGYVSLASAILDDGELGDRHLGKATPRRSSCQRLE